MGAYFLWMQYGHRIAPQYAPPPQHLPVNDTGVPLSGDAAIASTILAALPTAADLGLSTVAYSPNDTRDNFF